MSAGEADGEERPAEVRTDHPKLNDVVAAQEAAIRNGAGRSDGARQDADGSTGRKAKKSSLEEIIKGMKEQGEALKKSKKDLAKKLKAANRKRRRLKKRASMLSQEDLFELCRMRDLNPDNMEQDDEDVRPAADTVPAERTAHTWKP